MDYTFWLIVLFTVADLWVLITARSIYFGKSDSFGNKNLKHGRTTHAVQIWQRLSNAEGLEHGRVHHFFSTIEMKVKIVSGFIVLKVIEEQVNYMLNSVRIVRMKAIFAGRIARNNH